MRLAANVFAFILVIGACGCRTKLDESWTVDTAKGYTQSLDILAISNEQQVKVTGTATGGPVDVFVYLKKNMKAAENEITTKKFTNTILAKQIKTDNIDLVATVPANEVAVVTVNRAGAAAKVQLRITNQ
jgi:hypothetical protein